MIGTFVTHQLNVPIAIRQRSTRGDGPSRVEVYPFLWRLDLYRVKVGICRRASVFPGWSSETANRSFLAYILGRVLVIQTGLFFWYVVVWNDVNRNHTIYAHSPSIKWMKHTNCQELLWKGCKKYRLSTTVICRKKLTSGRYPIHMALRNLLFSLFLAFAHLTTAQQPLYAQCTR